MGVSIHYSGQLDDISRIAEFRAELVDIATSMKWNYYDFDENWDSQIPPTISHEGHKAKIEGELPVKGVLLTPNDGSESIPLICDRAGNLRTLAGFFDTVEPRHEYVAVKTQFGDSRIHLWLVGLLKYLKAKYIRNLEVHDEGGVWEGGSLEALNEKKAFLASMIDKIADRLANVESGGDDPEQTIEDVLKAVWKENHDQDKGGPVE